MKSWRHTRAYRMREALLDPSRVFGTPENVVSDPRLDRHAKVQVLRRWREALQALETENGADSTVSIQRRIQHALETLAGNGNA